MFTNVGFIGSGPLAQSIADQLIGADISVLISNSRGPATLTELVARLGERARAVTIEEAASADLVVLALPFLKVPDLTKAVPDWTGRIVVDATNQFAYYTPRYGGYVDLGDDTGSEWVRRQLPGATVIKAFNAMFATYIAPAPQHTEGRQVVFYAGDESAACTQFDDLLTLLGFAGVHVGGLHDGGRLLQIRGPLSAVHVLKQD